MYVVVVCDTNIIMPSETDDMGTVGEVEVVGPFPTEEAAQDWAWQEQRYLVLVMPVAFRNPS